MTATMTAKECSRFRASQAVGQCFLLRVGEALGESGELGVEGLRAAIGVAVGGPAPTVYDVEDHAEIPAVFFDSCLLCCGSLGIILVDVALGGDGVLWIQLAQVKLMVHHSSDISSPTLASEHAWNEGR